MKVLVKYIAFHPDNHQGGSGKSFGFLIAIDVPDLTPASVIKDFVTEKTKEMAEKHTPFPADFKFAIQRMELL